MIRDYLRSRRGAAAVEFAMWLAFLTVPVLNAIDVGFYVWQSMQVRAAAQSAVITALSLCGGTQSPVSANCTNFGSYMTYALQHSTSLGSQVSLASGSEQFYCVNSSNSPTLSNATNTASETISSSGTATGTMGDSASCSNGNVAGDYVTIVVNYTYHPLFSVVSIVSYLNTSVSQTVSVRVG